MDQPQNAASHKLRLDKALSDRGLVTSRSQAESYIKLGYVTVNRQVVTKAGHVVGDNDVLRVTAPEQYVSRAALKLASVTGTFNIDFTNKIVLDVGSSTGGFTDYALRNGAAKVIAVEVGTNQLHPSLHGHPRIELHEQTDIRALPKPQPAPDIVVIDVSFISLRDILPAVARLVHQNTHIIAMVKPQFEASATTVKGAQLKHNGVIKNDRMRRDILQSFEAWVRTYFIITAKADSSVAGGKGNVERFYVLKPLKRHETTIKSH